MGRHCAEHAFSADTEVPRRAARPPCFFDDDPVAALNMPPEKLHVYERELDAMLTEIAARSVLRGWRPVFGGMPHTWSNGRASVVLHGPPIIADASLLVALFYEHLGQDRWYIEWDTDRDGNWLRARLRPPPDAPPLAQRPHDGDSCALGVRVHEGDRVWAVASLLLAALRCRDRDGAPRPEAPPPVCVSGPACRCVRCMQMREGLRVLALMMAAVGALAAFLGGLVLLMRAL